MEPFKILRNCRFDKAQNDNRKQRVQKTKSESPLKEISIEIPKNMKIDSRSQSNQNNNSLVFKINNYSQKEQQGSDQKDTIYQDNISQDSEINHYQYDHVQNYLQYLSF